MIILQDLFNILATGVYANTTFSNAGSILKEEHYDKVSNLINLGVLEIYKRFKFLENELVLHTNLNTSQYYLRPSKVAAIDAISETNYIEQSLETEGFLNIIKLTAAYDSNGTELRINGSNSYPSELPTIVELAPDILRITNIITPQPLCIRYQSYPNKLTVQQYSNPGVHEFNIPDIVIDPLVSYIAAKTFKPMGANDSTANADKSASYEQQYELACQKLAMYGLSVQDCTDRDTFDSNGWA